MFFKTGILVFLIFGIIGGIFVFNDKIFSKNINKSATVNNTESIDWKIYRNTSFKTSVKYPPTLKVVELNNETKENILILSLTDSLL